MVLRNRFRRAPSAGRKHGSLMGTSGRNGNGKAANGPVTIGQSPATRSASPGESSPGPDSSGSGTRWLTRLCLGQPGRPSACRGRMARSVRAWGIHHHHNARQRGVVGRHRAGGGSGWARNGERSILRLAWSNWPAKTLMHTQQFGNSGVLLMRRRRAEGAIFGAWRGRSVDDGRNRGDPVLRVRLLWRSRLRWWCTPRRVQRLRVSPRRQRLPRRRRRPPRRRACRPGSIPSRRWRPRVRRRLQSRSR